VTEPAPPPPGSTGPNDTTAQDPGGGSRLGAGARAGANKYKSWPRWAKIAAPVAAVVIIGSAANAASGGGGSDAPAKVAIASVVTSTTAAATTTAPTTTTVVTTTTKAATTTTKSAATTTTKPTTATTTTTKATTTTTKAAATPTTTGAIKPGVTPVTAGGLGCPTGYPIKGNVTTTDKIFHIPGGASYNQTKPETCFATAADAQAAGFRPAAN
jgi:hypothetical protein